MSGKSPLVCFQRISAVAGYRNRRGSQTAPTGSGPLCSTDPAGKWKTFTTDAFGNLIAVTEPDPSSNNGGTVATNYTYNGANQLTGVSMPRRYRPDAHLRLDGLRSNLFHQPENGTVTYQYDGMHHVTQRSMVKENEHRRGATAAAARKPFRLSATKSSTAAICSRLTSNCSITSSMLRSSRFSMTVATGSRVPRNTHAPLTLPGMLSTAGQCDQSRTAISLRPFFRIRQCDWR